MFHCFEMSVSNYQPQVTKAEQLWTSQITVRLQRPCSWVSFKEREVCCNKKFTEIWPFFVLTKSHTSRKVISECKFGQRCTKPLSIPMNSRDERNCHLADVHGLTCSTSHGDSLFLCAFCDSHVHGGNLRALYENQSLQQPFLPEASRFC
jgi:hypothetical protein